MVGSSDYHYKYSSLSWVFTVKRKTRVKSHSTRKVNASQQRRKRPEALVEALKGSIETPFVRIEAYCCCTETPFVGTQTSFVCS
jgi:hypothetical protein